MMKDYLKSMGLRCNFLLLGSALAAAFWLLDPLILVCVFKKPNYINELIFPDAHDLWMRALVSCLFIVFGGAVHLTISQRRQVEKALRESEKQYKTLFDNAGDAIFVHDMEGRFLDVNQVVCERYGYSREDMLSMTPADIDSPENSQLMPERLQQLKKTGRICFEVFHLGRNGKRLPTEATVRLVEYAGQPAALCIGRDISERKLADEVLRQAHADLERQVRLRTRELLSANEQLLELNRQISAFLSSASHELRTPLTSVLGFAKLVQRSFHRHFAPLAQGRAELAGRAEVIEDNLAIIAQEGERLTRLINDLLDLNKIEAGRMEWRDQDLDTRDLVGDAARRAEAGFRFKPGVRFVTALPGSLRRLRADRDRIMQVLVNLLDNAAKFTEQGEVTLSARDLPGNGLEISVTDTGPGVPAQDRQRIFEKFFQAGVPGPEGPKPKGTGLGLAICRQIVEHYGGTIRVEDNPNGAGASFAVQLPVPPRTQSGAAALDSPPGRT